MSEAAQEYHPFEVGVFDQLVNPVLVTHPEGRYVDANPALLDLLGYTHSELLDLEARTVFASGREWPPIDLGMERREDGDWRGVQSVRRKDGSTVVVDSWSRVVRGNGPLVVSIWRERPAEQAPEVASDRDRENTWPLADFHLRPSVCIVDDDQAFVKLCAAILGPEGIESHPLGDLDHALEAIGQGSCSLLLVDIRLGHEGNGLELVRGVRAHENEAVRQTPIVLCTASTDLLRKHAEEINALNCNAIEKPFDIDDFVATLMEAVRDSPREQQRRD
ncbi:MAG TPA: response regulator [Dehalococcoidia bacterium]|nr:response regulator [Dehalococcoidia bacterium]